MNSNWKQDPRLKKMNSQKIALLNEFANRVEKTPQNQLMTTLMSLNAEANQKGIQFNNEETDLLVSIMSANMSPAERNRMETLRMLSKNLMNRNKK